MKRKIPPKTGKYAPKKNRIMVISTHGYVAAEPELGRRDTGGQVVYVLELSRHLAELGYSVDILTRRFEDQPEEDFLCKNVRVLRFTCAGKGFKPKERLWKDMPEWTANVLEFIKANNVSYRFLSSHYWDAGVAGCILSKKMGIPHLHTPHSIGAWKRDTMSGSPERLESVFNFSVRISEEKKIFDSCDKVIATTPKQKFLLSSTSEYRTDPEKISIIPPGYDDERFFEASEKKKRLVKRKWDAQCPAVLALGRIAKNKGYDLLIKSMKTVRERVPDARLILAIGSNTATVNEFRHLESLKRLACNMNLDDAVDFRGYVADEDIADYYHIADVFALSSRYDPFGMTAVEAMASGIPTVITTHGGLWKLVRWGEEALYADPKDSEAFGHAISTILMYPQVARHISKKGAEKARNEFAWPQVARQYDKILESVQPLIAL